MACSEGRCCLEEQSALVYLRMVPFPLPLLKAQGDFSCINSQNLVKLLEVKLTKVWWPPYDRVPLEFFSLRLVHTEPAAMHQLQFRFSYPGAGSHGDFCSVKLWSSVSA